MKKTIHSLEQKILIRHLRAARSEAQVSQVEMAKRLKETQSFVSKVERGERRLDVLEFVAFCKALAVDPVALLTRIVKDVEGC